MKVARAIVIVIAVAGPGCAGAPLGGGTGGHGAGGTTGLGGDAPLCIDRSGDGCKISGAGGSLGAGGTTADAGNALACAQLAMKYSAVLAAATACTPGAPGQCQVLVGNVPTNCPGSLCGEQSYVNDSYSAELEEVRQSWLNASCGGPPSTCIIACDGPGPSVCVPTIPGATTGTCLPYGSDAGASIAPDGGESCDQLVADYTAVVSAAQACTPGSPNQCQTYVTTTPSGCDPNCGVSVFVNDAAKVSSALQRWISQCVGTVSCPLIKCDPPVPAQGTCVTGGAAGGTCITGEPV